MKHFPRTILAAASLALLPLTVSAMPSSHDATFALKAAQAGMTEVKLAAIALQKSSDPRVLSFARAMNADHSKANAQLATIAKSEGLTPPSSVGPKNEALMGKLQALSGTAFDAMYLKTQLPAHREVLKLFKAEATGGSDSALVAFAKQTIPVIAEHITMDRHDIAKAGMAPMPSSAMK